MKEADNDRVTLLGSLVMAIACAVPPKGPPLPQIVPPVRRERAAATTEQIDLSSLRRLVHRFDFEDPERFPRELPEHWYRVLTRDGGRPGYPDFGAMRLVDDVARDGRWSLAFECRGGSMAIALPPGVVRILPGSHYRLTTWIRSRGLDRAGARLVARLHGSDGRPIGVEYATQPIRSEEAWTQVTLDLEGVPSDAAEITLELEVVQPSALDPDAARPVGDDIDALVWFDDFEIWQMPAIRFATDRPGQLFRSDETPTVTIELRDVVSDRLLATVVVEDIDGRRLVEERIAVAAAGEPLQLPLPALRRPGWYRATLVVQSDETIVARRVLDLAVVDGEAPSRGDSPRLGLALPPLDALGPGLTDALVERLAPDFVVMPCWDDRFDPTRTAEAIEALRPVLDRVLDRRVEPILVVPGVPESLAGPRHLDPWQALAFFGSDDPQAAQVLEPWLLAFGQHVERWQIGTLESLAARGPANAERAARLRGLLAARVADPTLLAPLEADREPQPRDSGVSPHLVAPWTLRSSGSWIYAEALADPEAILSIEAVPEEEFLPRARLEDLALRTLEAWRRGANALCLRLPMRSEEVGGERSDAIRPEALAWRQLARALGGRRFGGEIRTESGVRLWIARGGADAVVIAWSESGPRSVETVLAGRALRRTDLLGATSIVEPGARGHRLELDGLPTILEGVDPVVAELLASARFEPATLESRRVAQPVAIVLRNPTGGPLNGVLTIPDRLDWEISPRRQNVVGAATPGSEVRVPIELTLPRGIARGETTVAVDFEPSGGGLPPLRLRLPIAVDWPDVAVERSWRFTRSVETGRVDIAVTVAVTNRSDRPLDLEAFALARDFTQNRRPILRLGPGQTASRTFQFADGARRLSGSTVYAGVGELEGDRRLTLELAIPALLPPPALSAQAPEG